MIQDLHVFLNSYRQVMDNYIWLTVLVLATAFQGKNLTALSYTYYSTCFLFHFIFNLAIEVLQQPCWMAGATDFFFPWEQMFFLMQIILIVLPPNIAAVQNLYAR